MRAEEYCPRMMKELCSGSFWRDCLVEFFATFVLVSVEVALPLTWGQANLGTAVQTGLGMGFVVCAMAWSLGDFGGGFMNPAISFGMGLCMKITLLRMICYIIVQSLGGIAGAAFIYAVTPSAHRETLAMTVPGPDVENWQAFLIELWITCILVITVMGSTNIKRKGNLYMPPIAIGFAIALGIMSAFKSTGGSMNPARSLGPAFMMWVSEDETSYWDNHWVYWAGPLAGALCAALLYTLFDIVGRPKAGNAGNRNTDMGKYNESYQM